MKHLNPRQGITTQTKRPITTLWQYGVCETPKSPPGDYNSQHQRIAKRIRLRHACETPKSPPGDYNNIKRDLQKPRKRCVKHLNPRQGITTHRSVAFHPQPRRCETPKSPPGDYNSSTQPEPLRAVPLRVKHLNPRQGITTYHGFEWDGDPDRGVKHLNPRQGITTNESIGNSSMFSF